MKRTLLLTLIPFSLLFSQRPVFLMITPGARAVAMGSAFTGLADDATAVYYNPGALGFLDHASIVAMNFSPPPGLGRIMLERWLEIEDAPIEPEWLPGLWHGMYYKYGAIAFPILKGGTLGLDYTYLSTGKTLWKDTSYTSYDFAISVGYGHKLFPNFGAGISVKYIYSFLLPDWVIKDMPGLGVDSGGTGRSIALNFGLFHQTSIPGVRVGVALQNHGKPIKYFEEEGSEPLPKLLRLGFSLNPITFMDSLLTLNIKSEIERLLKVNITGDYVVELVSEGRPSWYGYGMEMTVFKIFSYRIGYFEDKKGWRWGSTQGMGINLGQLRFEIAQDGEIYAFHTSNWRVQTTITSTEFPFKIEENNPAIALFSSLLMPGGGQFYNHQEWKGSLMFTAGFYLADNYYHSRNTWSTIGLGLLYIISAVDALYSALHH